MLGGLLIAAFLLQIPSASPECRDFVLRLARGSNTRMIHFIEGQALGPQFDFSLRNLAAEIKESPDWRTFGFWRNRQPVAALTAITHQMNLFGEQIQGTYLTHAVVSPAFRGQGLARRLLRETLAAMPARSVQILTLHPEYEPSVRTFLGGGFESVDSILSIGYQADRKLDLQEEGSNIETLSELERKPVLKALGHFYRGFQLTDFETSLISKDFWVLKKKGRILAGLQQSTRSFRDVRKQTNFDATFIGNVFFVKGQESSIAKLIARVLKANKTHYFYWTGTPKAFALIRRSLTGFSKFHRDSSPLLVHANLATEEIAELKQAPLWFGLLNN